MVVLWRALITFTRAHTLCHELSCFWYENCWLPLALFWGLWHYYHLPGVKKESSALQKNWHKRFSDDPIQVLAKKNLSLSPSYVILQLELNVSFMHLSPLSFWIVSQKDLGLSESTVWLIFLFCGNAAIRELLVVQCKKLDSSHKSFSPTPHKTMKIWRKNSWLENLRCN